MSSNYGIKSRFVGYDGSLAYAFQQSNSNRCLLINYFKLRWNANDKKAFYCYYSPAVRSKHYRPGQSVCELFNWSDAALRTARKGTQGSPDPISTQLTTAAAKATGHSNWREYAKFLLRSSESLEHLILTHADSSGRTWHFFNERVYDCLMKQGTSEMMSMIQESEEEYRKSFDLEDYMFRDMDLDVEDSSGDIFGEDPPEIEIPAPKEYKASQKAFFGGKKMPEDYEVPTSVIQSLVQEGFDESELKSISAKFTTYYKYGEGSHKANKNWTAQFTGCWLVNAYELYNQIKKNGRYKDDKHKPGVREVAQQAASRFEHLND